MTYKIRITDTAKKEINKKLNTTQLAQLNKRVRDKLATGPDVYGKPLRKPMAGTWEIRFEKRYRLEYEIDYQNKEVIITGFKHKDETKHR